MLQLHLHFSQVGPMLHTAGLLAHHTASLALHHLLGSSWDLQVQESITYIKFCRYESHSFLSVLQSSNLFFLTGPTSPKIDILTGSTQDRPVQALSSAAPAPPVPVGQRSQTGATSARPTSTNTDSQKPPDLLEQRRGKTHFIRPSGLQRCFFS